MSRVSIKIILNPIRRLRSTSLQRSPNYWLWVIAVLLYQYDAIPRPYTAWRSKKGLCWMHRWTPCLKLYEAQYMCSRCQWVSWKRHFSIRLPGRSESYRVDICPPCLDAFLAECEYFAFLYLFFEGLGDDPTAPLRRQCRDVLKRVYTQYFCLLGPPLI
jgi:hypothetical protein